VELITIIILNFLLLACTSSQGHPIFYVTLYMYATVLLRVVSGGTLWRSRAAAFLFFSFLAIISIFYSTRPVTCGKIYCLQICLVKTVTVKCYRDGKSLNRIARNNVLCKTDIWILWHPIKKLCLCSVCFITEAVMTDLAGGKVDWRRDGRCTELISTPSIRVSKCIII